MEPREFCRWMQGYLEVAAASGASFSTTLDANQVSYIKQRLAGVFGADLANAPCRESDSDKAPLPNVASGHRPNLPTDYKPRW